MSASSTTLLCGTVVVNESGTPGRLITDGCVLLDAGTITFVGPLSAAPEAAFAPDVVRHDAHYVLPGLIDVHCHGGAGASFPNAESFELAMQVVNEHLRHGTTTMLASLVTDTREVLLERLDVLAQLCEVGALAGVHSEGPFLSKLRCGAQDPNSIMPVSLDLVRDMVTAARGHLRTMTFAPEVELSGELIDALIAGNVTPSIGHTDASAAQTRAAVARIRETAAAASSNNSGAPVATATHLFNGMRPVHHRTDGPILELMSAAREGDVVVEVIADNVHLSPDTVREVFDLVGAANIALVTDAMAACGMPDGTYQLGALDVSVRDGVARLAHGDSIAGGTAHLIDVVARTTAAGVPLVDAVQAASLTPARVLGLAAERGSLEPGKIADVLLCDADFAVLNVFQAGDKLTF